MIGIIYGKNTFNLDFISGIKVGIELYLGDDAAPGDLFAVTIDLFIVRFTYVREE